MASARTSERRNGPGRVTGSCSPNKTEDGQGRGSGARGELRAKEPPLFQVPATVVCVAAAPPSLATPQLAASDALDCVTRVFTARALLDARREKVKREAEAEKQAERDWQLEVRRLVKLRLEELEEEDDARLVGARSSATYSSHPQKGKRRKRKKRRKKRLPRGFFFRVCALLGLTADTCCTVFLCFYASLVSGDFVRCLGAV